MNTAISTPEGNCSDEDIRVVNGSSQAGRVEICINNAWGTVCDRLFGTQDAAVACAQLGGFNRNSMFYDLKIYYSLSLTCNTSSRSDNVVLDKKIIK